ncbi:ABC transporter substrate-binding protein [Phreatobacter oligotrophus]|uniref:Putative spermidine/putrescine transport system substrate-binding protein n=1 Tax=Phreatobacter oligotrophus TaxID=1122261 RepID=A0A2T4Z133_9HYPH|nr:extracellular solute-binding protein [Phreatobacter oligotrophus]PTM53435.1 putative spermidine/putrescine transport system substrate-binding protein [Phreatobacter oligotrophus]
MTKFTKGIDRRTTLKGMGLASAGALLPAGLGQTASAQAAGRVVVGTWGGDYARLLTKNVEDPFLKPKGFEVVQDQASDAPRRAKMAAERRLPRGTTDIQGLSAANMFEMNAAGLSEPIDYSKLKNAGNIIPIAKYPYGIGHIISGKVVVYNPKLVTPAPTSYKDCFDPKHGSKMGFIDIQYQYVMMAAGLAAAGDMTALEKAKEVLLAAKRAGARIYPTNEAFAQALKTEEITIGLMWKARAVQWQNAGITVDSVAPSEGTLAYISGFMIPKNAPNKAGAYAYMDAMLEKGAQEAFAVDMGYAPTVTNAQVAPDLMKRIGFTEEENKKMRDLDYDFLAKNDAAMKEWWDKVFKA